MDEQERVFDGRVDIGADEYHPFTDCNHNGIPDDEDIAAETSADCNGDQVPDECEGRDCNGNDVLDECDIDSGGSSDCNVNAVPDECERGGDEDCDGDAVSDLCEIFSGSPDVNVNGVPDECEPHVIIYVDDDGPFDAAPGDPLISDPDENGTPEHPYDAIQEALDIAPAGAAEIVSILVQDGVYRGIGNRDLDFAGKVLTLRSENGPETCIIDCQRAGRGFNFHNDETPASALEGFTIRNGLAESGGGIRCGGSTPSIRHCIITDNAATDWTGTGGGLYSYSDSSYPLVIRDCRVTGNTAPAGGAGVSCGGGTCVILNCIIAGNECTDALYGGGGVFGSHHCVINISDSVIAGNVCFDPHGNDEAGGIAGDGDLLTVNNCIITRNSACIEGGSAVHNDYDCSAGIRNSIIWNNLPAGSEIGFLPSNPPIVSYCDIAGGLPPGVIDGGGNIDADPLFVDWDGSDDDPNTWQDNDYRLLTGSPCIDAADSTAVPRDVADLDGDGDGDEPIPFDLDGNPRFVDDPDTEDTGNGTPPIVDMGAYEFQVGAVAHLDIKPGSCPNPLNPGSHGVLSVAIVGTAEFDVTQIDVDTLMLTRADGVGGSVAPLTGPPGPGIRVEDVATPFEGEPCDCHELGGDDIDDLSMKFDIETLVTELQLNGLPGGASVELVLSGEVLDGGHLSGADCITLVHQVRDLGPYRLVPP